MLDRGQILTFEQRQTLLASQQASLSVQQQQAYALTGYPGQAPGMSLNSPTGGASGLGGPVSPAVAGLQLGAPAVPVTGPGGVPTDAEVRNRMELERVYIVKQQRWLLFLRHASKCNAAEGKCPYTPHCHVARKLWEHVLSCQSAQCNYPRCVASRELLKHHQRCQDPNCPVCAPVRAAMMKQRQTMQMMQRMMMQMMQRMMQRIMKKLCY